MPSLPALPCPAAARALGPVPALCHEPVLQEQEPGHMRALLQAVGDSCILCGPMFGGPLLAIEHKDCRVQEHSGCIGSLIIESKINKEQRDTGATRITKKCMIEAAEH